MKAIIDRVENGIYVLESPNGGMFTVSPENAITGLTEGMVVTYEHNQITGIDFDETASRAERARKRLQRLKEKE